MQNHIAQNPCPGAKLKITCEERKIHQSSINQSVLLFGPTMQFVQWNLGCTQGPEAQSQAGSWNRWEQNTSGIAAVSSFCLMFP